MMATTSEKDAPTSEQPKCTSFPEFAVVCSFFEMFSNAVGVPKPGFNELQEMLENTTEVKQPLIDLHVKLMRKARKTISVDKWEKALSKFAHTYSQQDGWELERFGYKTSKLEVKLRLLKAILELQFDSNAKFKIEVNKLTSKELRLEPLGKDNLGCAYWCQFDASCNLRLYKEDPEEETWDLIAKDRTGLVQLIDELSSGEGQKELSLILQEEAKMETEKLAPDTGQENESVEEEEEESEEEEEEEEETEPDDEEDEDFDAEVSKKPKDINGEHKMELDEPKNTNGAIHNGFPSSELESNGLVDLSKKSSKIEEIFKTRVDSPFKDGSRSDILSQMSARFNQVDEPVSAPKKAKIIDEEIEEPLKYIEGLGSGVDCESVPKDDKVEEKKEETLKINKPPIVPPPPEFSEVVEEPMMLFTGLGSGVECDTGNPGEPQTETDVTSEKTESDKQETENGDVEENGESSKPKEGKEKKVMLTNIIEACLDHDTVNAVNDNSELDKQMGSKYIDLFSAKNIGERTPKSDEALDKNEEEEKSEEVPIKTQITASVSSRRSTRSNSAQSSVSIESNNSKKKVIESKSEVKSGKRKRPDRKTSISEPSSDNEDDEEEEIGGKKARLRAKIKTKRRSKNSNPKSKENESDEDIEKEDKIEETVDEKVKKEEDNVEKKEESVKKEEDEVEKEDIKIEKEVDEVENKEECVKKEEIGVNNEVKSKEEEIVKEEPKNNGAKDGDESDTKVSEEENEEDNEDKILPARRTRGSLKNPEAPSVPKTKKKIKKGKKPEPEKPQNKKTNGNSGGDEDSDDEDKPKKKKKSIKEKSKKELPDSENENSKDSKESENSKNAEDLKKKGRPKKSSNNNFSKSEEKNENPKPKRKKSHLLGLTERDLKIAQELKVDDDIPIEGGRMRQSRRIAQLKIKEEAERRAMEEAALAAMKAGKHKPKKETSEEEEDDEEGDDDDSNDATEKRRKKKKKKKDKLKFKIDKPWMSSSCSSTENEEEEDHYDEDDEDHFVIKKEASDHEFSPESDLEKDEDFVPVRHARTACKKKEEKKSDSDQKPESGYEDYTCEQCGLPDQPEWILLCDKCDKGYHASCLRPPIMLIPEGDWFCPPCQHATLVQNLKGTLRTFERSSKKRENEELRRKRLAYVGISLANVLPDSVLNTGAQVKKKKPKSNHSSGESSSEESSSSETTEYEDEPVYQLRQRRAAGQANYRFNDYDELINSAIQDEMEAVEPAPPPPPRPRPPTAGGKDIETIIGGEDKPEEVVVEEEEEELEGRKPPVVRTHGRKKSKKLNDLDDHSDDHDSDEDFKGTTDDDDDDYSDNDSDDSIAYRGGRQPLRRSNRARQARIDKDFIDDDSEDSSDRPRKKTRRMYDSEESESSSDRSWGRRKRKPQVKAYARTRKPKRGGGSRKKNKNSYDSDSDLHFRVKKPKFKYGLDENVDTGRKTRGKKINFREVIGSESDDEVASKKKGSEDEEFVLDEEEQQQPAVTPAVVVKKTNRIDSEESDEEEAEEEEVEDEEEEDDEEDEENSKNINGDDKKEPEKEPIPELTKEEKNNEEDDKDEPVNRIRVVPSQKLLAEPIPPKESVIRGMLQPSQYKPPNHQVPIHRVPNNLPPQRPRFVDRYMYGQPGFQPGFFPPGQPGFLPPPPLQPVQADEDYTEYQPDPVRYPATPSQPSDGEFGGLVSYFSSQHEDNLET